MKQVINMMEKYGKELHTRQMVERLSASMHVEDDYLLDMRGIEQISRSAADELYNLTHGPRRVEIINIEPFVEKMLSAVTLGRFLPRPFFHRLAYYRVSNYRASYLATDGASCGIN